VLKRGIETRMWLREAGPSQMRGIAVRGSRLNTSVRRRFPVLILAVAVLALALLALGCSSSTTTTTTAAAPSATTAPAGGGTTGPATTAGGAAAGNAVSIANFAFSPTSITAKVGDKVTWTNNDSTTHTVTADDNSFSSGDLAPGASFSFTFTKAGTFPYHCSIHSSMKATVVVQ
jgi:plastocyanin